MTPNQLVQMAVEEVVKFLTDYNAWRRGGSDEMPQPKQTGIVLDSAISILSAQSEAQQAEGSHIPERSILDFASYAYNCGRDSIGFKDAEAIEKWKAFMQSPATVSKAEILTFGVFDKEMDCVITFSHPSMAQDHINSMIDECPEFYDDRKPFKVIPLTRCDAKKESE